MAALVESLDAAVDRVEVTELRDGVFFAELTVSGASGGRRVDTRPSDAIVLALRLHAPLFVSDGVLDEAGAALPGDLNEETIETELAEFRSFLAGIAPADFDDVPALGPGVQELDAEAGEGDEPEPEDAQSG